jgi:lipoprotein-anchoring transpeptidase ErfK/SrfK
VVPAPAPVSVPEWGPIDAAPTLVVRPAGAELATYASPLDASPSMNWGAINEWDEVLTLPVVKAENGWLEVRLPERPNGGTGWVREGDVVTDQVQYRVQVSLSRREMVVARSGEQLMRSRVVIGRSSTPTPLTTGFVRATIRGDDRAFGPWVFALGIHSEVLTSFNGGDGEVAMHGTNKPELMGQAASNGCIRLPNDVVTQLRDMQIPLGTPVEIIA